MDKQEKRNRYLENIMPDALRQVIRTLMYDDKGKEIIQAQVDDFDKMFPKGGE